MDTSRLSALLPLLLALLLAACGGDPPKKGGGVFVPDNNGGADGGNNGGTNNGGTNNGGTNNGGTNNGGTNNGGTNNGGTNNGGTNNGGTNNGGLLCGNGDLDPGETCDGNCPTNCNDGESCTTDSMIGSADSCDAECVFDPITTCVTGDNCCPPGCTTSNDDDCSCTPTTSCSQQGRECGSIDNGCRQESCGTCNTGETCENGTCIDTSSDTGDACTTDTSCSDVCATESLLAWPGGYCTSTCSSNSGCETDAHCGFKNDQGNGFCVADCSTNSDCPRSGYECFDRDNDGVDECAPVASGSGSTGDTCDMIADCAGGQDGFCILEEQGWKDGYCSRACSTDSDCPNGHCSVDGACFDTCFGSGCRTGYLCYDGDDDGDDECLPAGTGTGDVGDACQGVWECDGGRWAICIDEQQSMFPGGYCSILCQTGEGTCPTSSACWDQGVCLETCSTGTCRTSYTCDSLTTDSGGTEMMCVPN